MEAPQEGQIHVKEGPAAIPAGQKKKPPVLQEIAMELTVTRARMPPVLQETSQEPGAERLLWS